LNPRLERIVAHASANPPAVVDQEILALAGKSVDRQSAALALDHLDLPAVWQITEEWVDRATTGGSGDQYCVLAGFAVVAAPVLPDTAHTVWRLLGLDGEPDRAGLRRLVDEQ
jgi:hypothetical protein